MANKIKKGLAGIILAGSGILASGCETGMETAFLGGLIGMSAQDAPTFESALARAQMGDLVSSYGEMQNQNDVARAGKTQITINNNYGDSENNKRIQGTINDLWVEQSVYKDGKKGMDIHVNFNVWNSGNNPIDIGAFFHYKNGAFIKDIDGLFCLGNGGPVYVEEEVIPPYNSCLIKDFVLFMPYEQILDRRMTPKNGEKIKLDILMFQNGNKVAESKFWYDFTFYQK